MEAANAQSATRIQSESLGLLTHALLRESLSTTRTQTFKIADCLREVTGGIGSDWSKYPVLGATRSGLAPAKEPVGKNPGRYKPVLPGTVFYNPMRILLGSIAMADEDDPPGITSPDYVVMTAIDEKLNARWFYHWFRSCYGEDFIRSLTRGAVRERLLFRRLGSAMIQLPDRETQQQVANLLLEAKRAKERLQQKLYVLDQVPAALLRQAFSGQI